MTVNISYDRHAGLAIHIVGIKESRWANVLAFLHVSINFNEFSIIALTLAHCVWVALKQCELKSHVCIPAEVFVV